MTGQTSFLQALGWAVLNSFWQMALLWVLYQLISAIPRSSHSSKKSSLAVILLLSGFAWFIYTFISVYSRQSATGTISPELIATADPTVNSWLQKLLPVASVAYLLLLFIPVSRFIRNYRYVQVIRRYGLTKIDVQWRVFVQKVAEQMGIKKPVHIWVSELISSPVTIGFLKPVILMPLAAINQLSVEQMESVLLHELSHIRRHDYFINLVINFIQTILYFNPFVKAFVRIVEKEREKSCDETVLQFQYNSYEYASALLTLEKNSNNEQAFVLAAAGCKNDLLHRIEAIVGVQKKKGIRFTKLTGLIAGLVCIIAFNALLTPGNSSNNKKAVAANSVRSSLGVIIDEESTNPGSSPFISTSEKQKISTPTKEHVTYAFTNAAKAISNAPGFINVNFIEPVEVTQLDKDQEDQVKAAIDASKKVIENAEWKTMEKNIADVLTQREKEQVKKEYRKELNKVDWNQWENKLRNAYNNVDWSRVNEQLAKAVNNIRMDSLQKAYNVALNKLDETSSQLLICDLKGIPDTDITLKAIEEKKLEVRRALNSLRTTRTKKIVHL